MEPPAAVTLDVSNFRAATPAMGCEAVGLMADARSDEAAAIRINDQVHLVPRICRFFDAYRDSDALRRAEFRKAVAGVSHSFRFVSSRALSLQDDIAAAHCIAHDAANIAYAIDAGETIDEVGLGSLGVDLPGDAYATLALAYRYVVGLYATDPTLSGLGEVAVRLVLLAEAEFDSTCAVTEVASVQPVIRNAFRPSQEVVSTMSIFVPPEPQNKEASLEAISQRLKDEILLLV
jgi:hypothetical protein